MGFGYLLRSRGKLAVELDTPGSHGFWPRCWGLDRSMSICLAISSEGSPYISRTSFSSMKSGAKQIVESMESTKDRVAVMTSPCAMVNNVSTTQGKFHPVYLYPYPYPIPPPKNYEP